VVLSQHGYRLARHWIAELIHRGDGPPYRLGEPNCDRFTIHIRLSTAIAWLASRKHEARICALKPDRPVVEAQATNAVGEVDAASLERPTGPTAPCEAKAAPVAETVYVHMPWPL
jgi:hypothetical protein